MIKKSLLSGLVILLSGCATVAPPVFYWEGYQQTLYETKKNPSDENNAKHMATLQEIIQKAAEKGQRIPPGVYSEVGTLLLREGNGGEAIKYFNLEKDAFPESTVFMQRMIQLASSSKSLQKPSKEDSGKSGK